MKQQLFYETLTSMKLECGLCEIFVLFCFFVFWRPGDHTKPLWTHIHFRRHWNQSNILVNLDVNGQKKYRLILGFVHTMLDSYFWLPIRYSMNINPICDSSLKRSARRSLAPSQKSRRHNRSCVWTEALSGIIFVVAQKLSSIMKT